MIFIVACAAVNREGLMHVIIKFIHSLSFKFWCEIFLLVEGTGVSKIDYSMSKVQFLEIRLKI